MPSEDKGKCDFPPNLPSITIGCPGGHSPQVPVSEVYAIPLCFLLVFVLFLLFLVLADGGFFFLFLA